MCLMGRLGYVHLICYNAEGKHQRHDKTKDTHIAQLYTMQLIQKNSLSILFRNMVLSYKCNEFCSVSKYLLHRIKNWDKKKKYNNKANSATLCRQIVFDLVPNWCLRSADLPVGFYCPEGTAYEWKACPPGTYSPDSGLSELSQCMECDGGHYCSYQNATSVSGLCSAGYYCIRGNTSPQPLTLSTGTMNENE